MSDDKVFIHQRCNPPQQKRRNNSLFLILALIFAGNSFANTALSSPVQQTAISLEQVRQTAAVTEAHCQTSCDDSCIQHIWAWADEFHIPPEVIPRDKSQLLALRVLNLDGDQYSDHTNSPKITSHFPEIGQLSQLQEGC